MASVQSIIRGTAQEVHGRHLLSQRLNFHIPVDQNGTGPQLVAFMQTARQAP